MAEVVCLYYYNNICKVIMKNNIERIEETNYYIILSLF